MLNTNNFQFVAILSINVSLLLYLLPTENILYISYYLSGCYAFSTYYYYFILYFAVSLTILKYHTHNVRLLSFINPNKMQLFRLWRTINHIPKESVINPIHLSAVNNSNVCLLSSKHSSIDLKFWKLHDLSCDLRNYIYEYQN